MLARILLYVAKEPKSRLDGESSPPLEACTARDVAIRTQPVTKSLECSKRDKRPVGHLLGRDSEVLCDKCNESVPNTVLRGARHLCAPSFNNLYTPYFLLFGESM